MSYQSDPAALSPGQEFPRFVYHATKPPVMVSSVREERALGPEWSRVYIHQEYPKVKHHWSGKTTTVKNADEDTALGVGWADRVTEFDAYKDARRIRRQRRDPGRWLDEWAIPGLSVEVRKRIKAQLLRADVAFERSLDSDPDSGALASMRQAFDGIARVLYEAGILSENLLHNGIPQFVWESAIAGGWWRAASETAHRILPRQVGRYWVWQDETRDWSELFRAEATEWEAKLLEDPPQQKPAALPPARVASGKGGILPSAVASAESEASVSNQSFSDKTTRLEALDRYTKSWKCSEAALARSAIVDRADLSKWKKGSLPAKSEKKARIEKALKENQPPRGPDKKR